MILSLGASPTLLVRSMPALWRDDPYLQRVRRTPRAERLAPWRAPARPHEGKGHLTLLRRTGTEPQDAIGRSDHSVPTNCNRRPLPPVNESRSGSRRAANARNRAYAILHKSGARSPQGRINRAIARQSSPIVVLAEQACHAGGRGFESRRSRTTACNQAPSAPVQAPRTPALYIPLKSRTVVPVPRGLRARIPAVEA
jgi:hypothetical protein